MDIGRDGERGWRKKKGNPFYRSSFQSPADSSSNNVRAVMLLSHCERPMVCCAASVSPQPQPFPCILAPSIDHFQYCRDETAEFRASPLTVIHFFPATNQTTNVARRLHGVAKETQRHYYTHYQPDDQNPLGSSQTLWQFVSRANRKRGGREGKRGKEVYVRDHD